MPYPRLGQRKCGDGKPSPYSGTDIDGSGSRHNLLERGGRLCYHYAAGWFCE